MREHIFVRPVRATDAANFTEWSLATQDNLFDPDVAKYPSTLVLTAFNRSGPILYAPIQRPLMIDALAFRPEADVVEKAMALKEITQAAVKYAYDAGAGEIYFVCKDESTIEIAKRHAYEEMPWKVCRLKLKDLEQPHAN